MFQLKDDMGFSVSDYSLGRSLFSSVSWISRSLKLNRPVFHSFSPGPSVCSNCLPCVSTDVKILKVSSANVFVMLATQHTQIMNTDYGYLMLARFCFCAKSEESISKTGQWDDLTCVLSEIGDLWMLEVHTWSAVKLFKALKKIETKWNEWWTVNMVRSVQDIYVVLQLAHTQKLFYSVFWLSCP